QSKAWRRRLTNVHARADHSSATSPWMRVGFLSPVQYKSWLSRCTTGQFFNPSQRAVDHRQRRIRGRAEHRMTGKTARVRFERKCFRPRSESQQWRDSFIHRGPEQGSEPQASEWREAGVITRCQSVRGTRCYTERPVDSGARLLPLCIGERDAGEVCNLLGCDAVSGLAATGIVFALARRFVL